jgi:hypothetical protein
MKKTLITVISVLFVSIAAFAFVQSNGGISDKGYSSDSKCCGKDSKSCSLEKSTSASEKKSCCSSDSRSEG